MGAAARIDEGVVTVAICGSFQGRSVRLPEYGSIRTDDVESPVFVIAARACTLGFLISDGNACEIGERITPIFRGQLGVRRLGTPIFHPPATRTGNLVEILLEY